MHPTDDSLSEPNMPATDAPVRKRRWTRWLIWLIVFSLVMLIAGELVVRFYLGLGDPPLTMSDPVMGYRFKPSMTYHRFGHVIHYNAYSERSDDFPPRKSQPGEVRVMVIGDSVINGGVLTDQSETSTAVLQRRLTDDLHRRVLVGNASAGGWGPPNELGYVQEFGFLDADVVVLVVSSHDASGFSWNVAVQHGFCRQATGIRVVGGVHALCNAPVAWIFRTSGCGFNREVDYSGGGIIGSASMS